AGRCLAPLGQVAGLMMQYQNARISLNSIDGYMKMAVERPAEKNFVPRPFLEGSIEFRDLSFTYPGSTQPSPLCTTAKEAPWLTISIRAAL
ncbi:MAG: hypothetical protein ACTS5Y_02370, partial [Pollutimonas bauzanensis]